MKKPILLSIIILMGLSGYLKADSSSINSPTKVSVVDAALKSQFGGETAALQTVVTELANTDYYKTAKALKIVEMQEKIQAAVTSMEESKAKAAVTVFNASKEIEAADAKKISSAGGLEGDMKRVAVENQKIAQERAVNAEKRLLELVTLNYISRDRAGISIGAKSTILTKGASKEGIQLIDIGSDYIKVKSKSGFIRTVSIEPSTYHRVPVNTEKTKTNPESN